MRPSRRATQSTEDDLDRSFVAGPIKRNRWLILAVVAVLAASPALSHLLESYRGIILERRDGEMFVGHVEQPPDWKDAIEAPAGTVIRKDAGDWSPRPVAKEAATDTELRNLYTRYSRRYVGTIVAIEPPNRPGGASIAVVRTDAGERLRVPLWSDNLAPARVGSRVKKEPGKWDPYLTDTSRSGAPEAPSTGSAAGKAGESGGQQPSAGPQGEAKGVPQNEAMREKPPKKEPRERSASDKAAVEPSGTGAETSPR